MKLKIALFSFISFIALIFTASTYAMDSMQMSTTGTGGNMLMTASFQLVENEIPLDNATVILGHQSRVSDRKGVVQFEDVMTGRNTLRVISQGKEQEITVDVKEGTNLVKLENSWKELSFEVSPVQTEQSQAQNLLVTMITVLLCFGVAMVLIKKRHLLVPDKGSKKRKIRRGIIGTFLVFGLISASALGYQMIGIARGGSQAFIHSTMAAEVVYTPDSAIPQPANVKTFGDDRVATVTWDPPAGAESKGIIGYVVRWGLKSGGILTDSKQTIYDQTQIQPLQKNQEYIVTVQSVKGKKVSSLTKDGFNFKTGKIEPMVFEGEYVEIDYNAPNHTLSLPVQTTVKENSARVDAMRLRNTGFFDDFNLPSGNLDETKWNTAYTGCATPGFNGTFINSQFHAHNQVQARSDYLDYSASGLPYCDRAAVSSRARGVFDTSKATETNPAVIEVDVDGVPRHRDAWYIDFIPTNSRLNGVPVDLEGHDDIFQADTNEPANVMRLVENNGGIMLVVWDANRKPSIAKIASLNCPAWQGDRADLGSCNLSNKITKYSGKDANGNPLPQNDKPLIPIPNVRRHWVVEYARSATPDKSTLSLSIDGIKVLSYYVPENVDSFEKYQITTELFSYTTGKEHEFDSPSIMPTTTLFHWDNFGFSGAAQQTVVHNYLDGGADGMSPQYATGTYGKPIQRGNRTAKFNIPDQIGKPIDKGARVMFTIIELGNGTYTYPAGASITVNGHSYPVANPNSNVPGGNLNPIASSYTPHSTGIYIDPAHLVNGMNTVQFNLGSDIINAHIELEYTNGTEPSYTQPQNVFSNMNFNSFITPNNNFNDSYLFIEQSMGLLFAAGAPQPTSAVSPTTQPSATPRPSVIPSSTPRPTTGPSATPFPTVTRTPTSIPTATPLVQASPTPVPPTVAPTSVPSSGGTLGYTQIGSSTDSNDSNYINSSRFKMGSIAKVVKSMSVYVGNVGNAPNNQFQVGIYTDKNGRPDRLIAKSQSGTLTANSWNTIAITANLEAGKNYWLAYNTNGSNGGVNNMKYSSNGKDAYTSSSTQFGSWPQTFGGSTVGTFKFSIYASFL